jgi:hypothetical protein
MPLEIEASIADRLPSLVKDALSKMPSERQSMFVEEYRRKARTPALMLILAVVFPIQLFLLGRAGLGIAFLLTAGGFAIWYVIEIFLAIPRTHRYNQDVAMGIIRDIKILQ